MLVVERDRRVRDALCAVLTAAADVHVVIGCEIEAAGSASGSFDVAVVGVSPPTDGLELVSRLSVAVPVIAVSDSAAARASALSAGAVAACDEDGNIDALLGAIRTAQAAIGGR